MKILVMSDSHLMYDIDELLDNEVFDLSIHAGDSELEADSKTMSRFDYKVRGNCDYDNGYKTLMSFTIDNKKIILNHGHLLEVDVKYSNDSLKDISEINNVDFSIYGHTHIVDIREKNNVVYVNPGSVSLSKSKYPNTYVIIDTSRNIIELKNAQSFELIEEFEI